MSDELVVGASQLARDRGVGLTFHLSPHSGDAASYSAADGSSALRPPRRTGRVRTARAGGPCGAPGRRRAGRRGAHRHRGCLVPVGVPAPGPGHDRRRPSRRAAGTGCPGGAGMRRRERRRRGRHPARRHAVRRPGPRPRRWIRSGSPPTTGLALATIGGARAIGKGDSIGSIEVGKQADLVVHDRRGPQWVPQSTDPVLQLIWASDGRSVSDVLIAGRHVVRDGRCITVDLDSLRDEAARRRDHLLASRG